MEQDKLLILGASYSQIPLMEAAKRLGYRAAAASIPGPYSGFSHADEVIDVDISDPEATAAAAREAGAKGVATCCMDVGIRALGAVCEALHLPGPGAEAAQAAANKLLEKTKYMEHGVNTARFKKVRNEEELRAALDELTFPVIVKAVDLMGSRGIVRCDTPEEAQQGFAFAMAATKEDYCIVEEYLLGEMFGAEAMMQGGELIYLLPLGNDTRDGNPPFPVGHYVPWGHPELEEKVRAQVLGAAKALGFDNCAMDFDCMLCGDEVYIIEATCRAGATCITDTVGIYYGIDYFEAIVKTAMGVDASGMFTGPQVPRRPSVSRLLSAGEPGVIARIIIPEDLPSEVYDLSFNIKEGDAVRPMTNGAERIGQLIVTGESVGACRALMGEVLKKIRLEFADGRSCGVK